MKRFRRVIAAFAFGSMALTVGAQSADQQSLVLAGGRVYPAPDAAPIYDGVVVVEKGRIAAVGARTDVAIPQGFPTIDCKGLAVVAGFQNSHVHFSDPSRWAGAAAQPAGRLAGFLQSMLTRYGFTTVVDTASDLENTLALRKRIEAGEIAGPRILTAGSALYPSDGIPYYIRDSVPPEVRAALPQPGSAAEATAVVRGQLERQADLVKLFTGSWVERGTVKPMDPTVATAAVREADRFRRPVFAHASNVAGLDVALRSGVDVLAHALDDVRGLTKAHLEKLAAGGVAMIPTLALFKGDPDVLDEVRVFSRLGGDVLFGTDVGYLPDFDTADEFRLMAAAGLGWREILASLTTTPARRFGEASVRGTVAAGMAADLVVIAVNPGIDALDADAFANVRYTIRAGRVIYDSSARGDTAAELEDMQHRLRRAILERRRDDYAMMLAPEWRVTHVDGQVLTRDQVLDMVFGGSEPPFTDASQDGLETRLFGDAAVVTGRSSFTLRDGSRIALRFTDFLARRDGRWVVVASHATRLP